LQDTGATTISIDPNGFLIKIFDGYPIPLMIDMRQWCCLATQTISDFASAVNDILPTRITADGFPVNDIVDHDLARAAHIQEHNAVWMDPIRDAVCAKLLDPKESRHRLFNGVRFNPKAVEKWLALDQDILTLLLTVFALTAGACVRGFQFKSFRFDATDNSSRNMWLLASGSFILANPIAKQLGTKLAPTLLSFPPVITKYLAFYIYIVRPVIILLLPRMGKEAGVYSSVIWARVTPRRRTQNKWEWTGRDATQALKKTTQQKMGLGLHLRMIRQIVQAIFRDKYPAMFESILPNSGGVGTCPLQQYSQHCNFPVLSTMDSYQAVKLLAVSEIWQAGIEVGPLNEAWQSWALGSRLFPSHTYDNLAFLHARHTIAFHYGVGQGVEGSDKCACQLLKEKPFLYGSQVCSFGCEGLP
jgi:hypothetical protein